MKCAVFYLAFIAISIHGIPMYELNSATDVSKAPEPNGNLAELAETLGLTTLVDEAKKADIAQILEMAEDLTLFGPTNEGFEKVPDVLKPLLSNTTTLKFVLLFHVIKGKVYANQIKNELLVPSILETNPKFFIRFNIYKKGSVVTAQCSRITKVNQNASNGVLHVVDRVLIPAGYSFSTMLVVYKQYYSTLVFALKKANLFDVLNGKGPFTVFAPTNAAFDKIPKDKLAKILADIPLLTKILKYHVVSGTFCSAGLSDSEEVPTLEGGNVTVHFTKSGVYVNDALVVYPDASVTNGVSHAIDTVLIPDDVVL